jgi:hypothetical protein
MSKNQVLNSERAAFEQCKFVLGSCWAEPALNEEGSSLSIALTRVGYIEGRV